MSSFSCRSLLDDTKGEKQLLGEEAEQLKLVLKRELEKLESELASKVHNGSKELSLK